MALTVGVPLANGSATTLGDLLDGVFSNRSPTLDSASAVFTPSDANVLVVSWPAVGDDVVYMRLAARPTSPEFIELAFPPPTLVSVSPNTVTHGATDTAITVSGTNFVNGAVVIASGTNLTTTFTSSTSLGATILAAQLASAGTLAISVQNPDGQIAGSVTFTVS